MANYNYKCFKCEFKEIKSHPINDKPNFECPCCGDLMVKIFTPCTNFSIGNKLASHKQDETLKRHQDMSNDLKENYGVHGVTPLSGRSYEDIYSSIKQSGSSRVKEHMDKTTEENLRKSRRKVKDQTAKSIEKSSKYLENKNIEKIKKENYKKNNKK